MANDISIGKLFVELLVNDAKFGPALKGATAELNKLAAEAKRSADTAAAAVKPLATAFTTVTAAEKQHIAAIVASQAAETQRAAALGITTGQLRQVDAALKAETAATAAATVAAKGHAAALKGTTASSASLAGASTNLRFQLFDVVQQVSAGQNPLMILNQQGFQIAQVFTQGGSAAGIFAGALGPLAPILAGIVAAAGPVLVVIAAMVTAYSVFANAAMQVAEETTGARDAAIDAADKIKGTKSDMEEGRKAWERFRDTVEQAAIATSVANGTLTKEEAATMALVKKARTESTAALKQFGDEWAAVTAKIEAYEAVDLSKKGFYYEDLKEANEQLPQLRKEQARLQHELAMKHAEIERGTEIILGQGVAETKAGQDKEGIKDKADATRDQAAALRDYAAAMKGLAKVSEDASDKASLTAFDDLGGSSKTERTFQKATEKARQDAEKSVAAAETALAEALAAAKVIGGEAGAQMAEGARTAFATANDVFLAELVQAQDDAVRTALETQKAAAAKRVDANMGAISIQVQDEEAFADTLGKIREETVARYAELAQVDVEYARLSADERVAVEAKIQAEIDTLRQDGADAELARAKEINKQYGAEAKDLFAMTKDTINQLSSMQADEIQKTADLFAADADAREKLARGETLTAAEQAALMTDMQKVQLDKRYEDQKATALSIFYAQQAAALATIAINTAVGVSAALTLPPPASFIAAAVVAALGVVQAGIVTGQKPPEFHVGGVVDESDRRSSPGRSTDRAVTTELEVGEGVLVSRAVQALGGSAGLARLNVDPVAAISSIASRVSPVSGIGRSSTPRFDPRSFTAPPSPPPFSAGGGAGSVGAGGSSSSNSRPIVVVSKIGERTFDTIMAEGIDGRRLPKVRSRLQRMTGVTVGLEG